MKTRLGVLIVAMGVLWGCGDAPTQPPPPPPVTVSPAPPVTPGPDPTPPPCRIHKLCQD